MKKLNYKCDGVVLGSFYMCFSSFQQCQSTKPVEVPSFPSPSWYHAPNPDEL